MTRRFLTFFFALSLLCLSGCLLEDTTHTLYIEPDGRVTWRVLRDLVRSDHDDLDDRYDEESKFLAAVDGGEGYSELFAGYGAEQTRVQLLRAERPYTVMVSARFAHVRDLVTAMQAEDDSDSLVSWEQDGSLRSLRVVMDPEDLDDEPEQVEGPQVSDDFRLVLTEGRFVEAEGFELAEDGAVAIPWEHDEQGREVAVYALVWDVDA